MRRVLVGAAASVIVLFVGGHATSQTPTPSPSCNPVFGCTSPLPTTPPPTLSPTTPKPTARPTARPPTVAPTFAPTATPNATPRTPPPSPTLSPTPTPTPTPPPTHNARRGLAAGGLVGAVAMIGSSAWIWRRYLS